MELPKQKSEIVSALDKQTILIYGRAKIGKSTLASQFPTPLFLATEAGLNHLSVHKTNITSWLSFLEACVEIQKGNHEFKTIVIDTIDNLVSLCSDYICKREKIDHPADMPMGKGWYLITEELKGKLIKLSMLPYGLVFISHCKNEVVKTRTAEYNRYTISISGTGSRRVFLNMSDLILFVDSKIESNKERRIIYTKPSRDYEAGDRTGLLPETLELNYDALIKYFK